MSASKKPRRPRRLSRLQWQLARTFVFASVGVVLSLLFLIFVTTLCIFFLSPAMPYILSKESKERIAPRASRLLIQKDTAGLLNYLSAIGASLKQKNDRVDNSDLFSFNVALKHRILLAITDIEGNVQAGHSFEISVPPLKSKLRDSLSPIECDMLMAALRGDRDADHLARRTTDNTIVSVVPLLDKNRIIGAFFVRFYVPFNLGAILGVMAGQAFQVGTLVVVVTLIPAIIGGFIAARSLTGRLTKIAGAAEAWGRGDFSQVAPESGRDELGLFGQRLNGIRTELEETLRLRQQLAGLEERQRLARDLHDTVKQEIFALTMQLSALHALSESERAGNELPLIRNRLAGAERLAVQVQQELTGVIRELLPGPAGGETPAVDASLSVSMRHLVENWSRYSNITLHFSVEGSPTLRSEARANLLRIVREALGNIARHSGAEEATVTLCREIIPNCWRLLIADNGQGFIPETINSVSGMGLQNMRERAAALPQGSFTLRTIPGEGTTITVCFHSEDEK